MKAPTIWRRWIRSNDFRQVHSLRTSSTSIMQFGGSQSIGGGKRSTPRTVADSLVSVFRDYRGLVYFLGTCLPHHYTLLEWGFGLLVWYLHSPATSACPDVKDFLVWSATPSLEAHVTYFGLSDGSMEQWIFILGVQHHAEKMTSRVSLSLLVSKSSSFTSLANFRIAVRHMDT